MLQLAMKVVNRWRRPGASTNCVFHSLSSPYFVEGGNFGGITA
jgi:hypothetical protein